MTIKLEFNNSCFFADFYQQQVINKAIQWPKTILAFTTFIIIFLQLLSLLFIADYNKSLYVLKNGKPVLKFFGTQQQTRSYF